MFWIASRKGASPARIAPAAAAAAMIAAVWMIGHAPIAPAQTAPAIHPLPNVQSEHMLIAQQLLLADRTARARVIDPPSGEPMRAAVFHAAPATDADVNAAGADCSRTICYRLDVYNYALNATFAALVDVLRRRVIRVGNYQIGQPELPGYLVDRALEIAVNAPEVAEALGFRPDPEAAVMANVKTALNNTECESSRHLCVAPTFVLEEDDTALWAIVDLTDERLVAVRWTDLGAVKRIRPTEQSIRRDQVYEKYCRERQVFERGDWRFEYMITASDGLEVTAVTFEGRPVLAGAKLVDWHVSYSNREGFGYSDAVGCPKFSSAAVGAMSGPDIEALEEDDAFAMEQDFVHPLWPAPCNYRYKQRFEFYADGRLRVAAGQYGRGCGVEGVYQPVLRIRPAPDAGGFSEWDGGGWRSWQGEGWRLQGDETTYHRSRYQYRIGDDSGGWYIEPGTGQFPHNRGDNAHVYVTRHHVDEGDDDLITIGPCCNMDHRQGPEKFIDEPPERLAGDYVIWYVPRLQNDDTPGAEYCWADNVLVDGMYEPRAWPCYSGPMLVPYGARRPSP